MGLLRQAKRLDDVVLGTSDSTRGFLINAWMGLHPMLAPIWIAAAVLFLVGALLLLVQGSTLAAVECLAFGLVAAARGYVCRRLPRLPRT